VFAFHIINRFLPVFRSGLTCRQLFATVECLPKVVISSHWWNT